jgi:hypothetical protein
VKHAGLFLFLTLALLSAPACSTKPVETKGPSGCPMREVRDEAAGVVVSAEACEGKEPSLRANGDAIELVVAGQATKIAEVYAKAMRETLPVAIRKQFLDREPDNIRLFCEAQPSVRVKGSGDDLLIYEIQPMKNAKPASCGEHGVVSGSTGAAAFFLHQPKVTPTRYLYVLAGEGKATWQASSVRLIPNPGEAAAAWALAIDEKAKDLKKVEGRFDRGGAVNEWTAFYEGGKLVMISHRVSLLDLGNSAIRYYYRDGAPYFAKEAGTRAKGGKDTNGFDEFFKQFAYGTDGRVLSSSKTMNRAPVAAEAGEAESLLAGAKELAGMADQASRK